MHLKGLPRLDIFIGFGLVGNGRSTQPKVQLGSSVLYIASIRKFGTLGIPGSGRSLVKGLYGDLGCLVRDSSRMFGFRCFLFGCPRLNDLKNYRIR